MAKRFDRVKFEEWRRRLARFDSAGLTVAEFCRREQVSLASYYYWSRRVEESAGPPLPAAEEPIDEPSHNHCASAAIEVWLPGGVRVVVPADCTQVLPLILQSAGRLDVSPPGGKQTPAFQQVLVKSCV
jgi:hypothetical protein